MTPLPSRSFALEFTVAAYRFGHTMIRDDYDFNLNFNRSGDPGTSPADLGLLFTFTASAANSTSSTPRPGQLDHRVEHFVDTGTGAANKAPASSTPNSPTACSTQTLKGQEETPPTRPACPSGTCCAAMGCACPPARPWPSTSASLS